DLFLRVEACKQVLGVQDGEGLVAVFPGGGRGNFPTQQVVHKLDAVTNAQDRHAQGEDLRIEAGGVRLIDAAGPAGEDEAPGGKLPDASQRQAEGVNLAVDLEFPYPPSNKLGVLGAEVQNQDFFFMRISHFEFRVPSSELYLEGRQWHRLPACDWVAQVPSLNPLR